MTSNVAALPYHEPEISVILVFASFLILLNVVNYALDYAVYCGLIGQILIGVAWGLPGAKWLPLEAQDTIMQLGYLGLILVVYEGGLSTNIKSLKANLLLSATVALIGISAPIALSFVLQSLLNVTPLQAFAAGAALCSTSLGTTFTVLSTSGLSESRLGVVLTSAAMMDDVVGLVMVQVISNIGQGSTFSAITVVRPICVSIAFAVLIPLLCLFVVKPLGQSYGNVITSGQALRLQGLLRRPTTVFILHTTVLLALVTGSSYAGTSNLFAAYLAGASISWWDGTWAGLRADRRRQAIVSQGQPLVAPSVQQPRLADDANSQNPTKYDPHSHATGIAVYERFYSLAVTTILKPFFFASIGFSIPVSMMFTGNIVWRGFVYTTLMAFGKLVCGLCLVHFDVPKFSKGLTAYWPFIHSHEGTSSLVKNTEQSGTSSYPRVDNATPQNVLAQSGSELSALDTTGAIQANISCRRTNLAKPRSLYPATILGSAMMARGEIGFLISSVAESKGIYSGGTNETTSELYLVVTWAILLCTIIGPVTVGLLVKRVKRLQILERGEDIGHDDPLGIWGVAPS